MKSEQEFSLQCNVSKDHSTAQCDVSFSMKSKTIQPIHPATKIKQCSKWNSELQKP